MAWMIVAAGMWNGRACWLCPVEDFDVRASGNTALSSPCWDRSYHAPSGIQLAVGPQPLWLRNHNSGLAHRIMVKRLAASPHDPLGITDSACKNQLVVVSVQYGPFNPYIPIRSTTIDKSRVAIDPIAMHTSWRSNSDIASVTSIGYPRMSASGEFSTMIHRLLHASGSHPIPTPYDPNSSSSGSRVEFCGFCGGKHSSTQCVGVQGSCNLCGQYGHFARVCPSAGAQQTAAQPQGCGGQSRGRSQQFQQPRFDLTSTTPFYSILAALHATVRKNRFLPQLSQFNSNHYQISPDKPELKSGQLQLEI
ncbi:hypothetical protein F511_29534 [Dorcoceras hygrometricum]|uniref:CCHC-type domain-containing protein n=1 Tax=Dorcoceras hygrometricum TaxID=472368 RepID=A0A2Z7A4H6_9LAMI|nr:hypothetical protein F511_29534 [Dorcoceras hygrometricum]